MPGYIVVGMQWGEKEKGKPADFLTKKADVSVRYQGGKNEGHRGVLKGKKLVTAAPSRSLQTAGTAAPAVKAHPQGV